MKLLMERSSWRFEKVKRIDFGIHNVEVYVREDLLFLLLITAVLSLPYFSLEIQSIIYF